MSKTYDYKTMIQIYVSIPHRNGIHEDFRNYREGLVEILESIFGIIPSRNREEIRKLNHEYLRGRDIFSFATVFDITVTHLRRTETVGVLGRWLEGSPRISVESIRKNHPSTQIEDIAMSIESLDHQHQEITDIRYNMLYNIFQLFNGDSTTVITSEDLFKLGFDDTKEPKISDYYDYF